MMSYLTQQQQKTIGNKCVSHVKRQRQTKNKETLDNKMKSSQDLKK